jgi:hypothetical protein
MKDSVISTEMKQFEFAWVLLLANSEKRSSEGICLRPIY